MATSRKLYRAQMPGFIQQVSCGIAGSVPVSSQSGTSVLWMKCLVANGQEIAIYMYVSPALL